MGNRIQPHKTRADTGYRASGQLCKISSINGSPAQHSIWGYRILLFLRYASKAIIREHHGFSQ